MADRSLWVSKKQACLPSNLNAPALTPSPHWALMVSLQVVMLQPSA